MSRKYTKSKGRKDVGGVIDPSREATTTPLGAVPMATSGGGSAMGGMLTEGSFIQAPKPTFVEGMYGTRYLTSRPQTVFKDDIAVRMQVWAFSIRGYINIGAYTLNDPQGVDDGETLLQDWYGHVRDMAKRSLKYRHLPATLTDTDTLIHYLDAYYYVLANLTWLLNLNRLVQYNTGFSAFTAVLPRYMSRIIRSWRRLSALKAPRFIKAHAIRNGLIVMGPNLQPTIRVWSHATLFNSAAGGPVVTDMDVDVFGLVLSTTQMDIFINNLELTIRWLEAGTAAIATDFLAVKDLIDMTSDITPGAFETGLPESSSLPGVTYEPTVINDLLMRAYLSKDVVTAGTDRWIIFPVPGIATFGSRIPIAGRGAVGVYDFTLLGAPKFGVFNAGTSVRSGDVDSICQLPGTDFKFRDNLAGKAALATRIKDTFGVATGQVSEEIIYNSPPCGTDEFYDAFDCNTASEIRKWRVQDSLRKMHIWSDSKWDDRDAFANDPDRRVEESAVDYVFWMEPEDLGWNYAEFLGTALGIPYLR